MEKFENYGPKSDLANKRTEGKKLCHHLSAALQPFFSGLTAPLQLLAAWSENYRRRTGITQTVHFP